VKVTRHLVTVSINPIHAEIQPPATLFTHETIMLPGITDAMHVCSVQH